MPEFDRNLVAALQPFNSDNIPPGIASVVMSQSTPPDPEKDPIGYMDWWIEAACRLRYRYADIMQRISSEQKDGA